MRKLNENIKFCIVSTFSAVRKGWILFILLTISFPILAQPSSKNLPDRSTCNSYIHIIGESNVNQFNFTYDLSRLSITESANEIKDTGQFEIIIPIKDFKASNPLMYNDFLQLMRAAEYPKIRISIPKSQLSMINHGTFSLCPEMNITIAGITHLYKIDCSIVKCSETQLLVGSQKLKLTDFKLEPPEKLYGLVKVSDEIEVNFSFIITFTENNLIAILR